MGGGGGGGGFKVFLRCFHHSVLGATLISESSWSTGSSYTELCCLGEKTEWLVQLQCPFMSGWSKNITWHAIRSPLHLVQLIRSGCQRSNNCRLESWVSNLIHASELLFLMYLHGKAPGPPTQHLLPQGKMKQTFDLWPLPLFSASLSCCSTVPIQAWALVIKPFLIK